MFNIARLLKVNLRRHIDSRLSVSKITEHIERVRQWRASNALLETLRCTPEQHAANMEADLRGDQLENDLIAITTQK